MEILVQIWDWSTPKDNNLFIQYRYLLQLSRKLKQTSASICSPVIHMLGASCAATHFNRYKQWAAQQTQDDGEIIFGIYIWSQYHLVLKQRYWCMDLVCVIRNSQGNSDPQQNCSVNLLLTHCSYQHLKEPLFIHFKNYNNILVSLLHIWLLHQKTTGQKIEV